MTPRQPDAVTRPAPDLFRECLDNMLNQRHALYRLADLLDWSVFDKAFGALYCPDNGCPGKPMRLMVGLQYLKHCYGLSDEAVVSGWVENPYWQYFCGETYFRHEAPVDPSSLTRFRQRIGESGCETILQVTVAAGVALRQSYARVGPKAWVKAHRYAHARQYQRLRREVKRLRTYLGRVVRDSARKTADSAARQAVFAGELALAKRLLVQQKADKNKLYSLHAPEVECISKGKAHKRYEFGVKASIATTNKSNFVVGGMAVPGNPYDGHTLKNALEQVRRVTGLVIDEAFVDKGYRGHGEKTTTVYISGQKRGISTQRLKRSLKRRQAIEPIIGHLKADGRLGRNFLKGAEGDQVNVLLSCAGHNLRLVLNRLRLFCLEKGTRLGAWLRRWAAPRRLSGLPATSMAA